MTNSDTTTAPPTGPTWNRWLYPALAATGIAVGIFVIAAGLYLLIAQPGSHMGSHMNCCASMHDEMKSMHMPSMSPPPSMSPMPGMPTMPNMPTTTPSR